MDLNSSVTELPLVGPAYSKRLKRLEISTIDDLLHHVPRRYLDFSKTVDITDTVIDDIVTVSGEVTSIKNQYTKYGKKLQIAELTDKSGSIMAIWFNQPYLVQSFSVGTKVSLAGKVGWYARKKAFVSPEYEIITGSKKSVHTGRLIPLYPETAGVSSKWLRGRVAFAYPRVEKKLTEYLPASTIKNYNFLKYNKSISAVHFPDNSESAENGKVRLSFNELLFYQLQSLLRKRGWQKTNVLYKLGVDKKIIDKFINSLPFELTKSQKRSVVEIINDLERDYPMNRLLEGDVGSGKTVVAAAAALVSFTNGYQTAIMAPTQILAEQHFTTLREVFKKFKIRISLITSTKKKADIGKADIFVGTHALIHKVSKLDQVALVIIDEQHRFGVEQRAHLVKGTGKNKKSPHVLTMTATPIPRTVALTAYGDLDLSTLDEMPKGRKKITTWIVPQKKRNGAYGWIKEQINSDAIQVFVICPLIEESQKETMQQVKAATAEFDKLSKIFENYKLGLLHSKLKQKEKDGVMKKFRSGKINILVSTPVVEVGVDIPNATIMLIEAADRFGLAQLHQLRGRVGRGKVKSYCLLFTESRGQKVTTRLKAMAKTTSGFELAELDLRLRGPGEIFGVKQSGFPELKIASWQDINLIKSARKVAQDAINDENKYKKLHLYLNTKQTLAN